MNAHPSGAQPLKIGLIGYGRISRIFHLKILQSLRGAKLVSLAEADEQSRAAAAEKLPGVTLYTDYRELIKDAPVEAVVICLPSGMHAEAATFALEHDKHVYLEKPLAISLDEARALLAVQQSKQKVGMVGFNWRFHPVYQQLKKELSTGKIGNVVSVRTTFSNPRRNLPEWKKKRESGGGVLLDLASHHIDLLYFLFGERVSRVTAFCNSSYSEQDTAHLQFKLENGLSVQSFFSAVSIEEDCFEIFGEKGKLTAGRTLSDGVVFSGLDLKFIRFKKLWRNLESIVHSPLLLGRFRMDPNFQSFYQALNHFTTCIQTHQPAHPSFQDGYRSLEAILAAETSNLESGGILAQNENISNADP